MTSAVELARPARRPAPRPISPADVFVVFGITGDLAKVMTLHSLYRLEARGLLELPDRRRRRRRLDGRRPARARPRGDRRVGRDARPGGVRPVHRAALLRRRRLRGRGDVRARRRRDWRARAARSSTSRSRRSCSAPWSRASPAPASPPARASSSRSRSATTSSPPRALAEEMHEYLDERQLYRIDHYLGKLGRRGDPLPALRERDPRARLAPQPRRERPDHDGRGLRRRGPRPLLRPGRRAARRGREPPDAGRRRGRDGGAGGARPRRAQERPLRRLPRDAAGRPGALRPRPARRLPRDRRRRRRTRRPRPTRRCGWRSTTGAGRACPSSSGPASACPSPRPSCGWCSSGRRAWASATSRARRPSPTSSSSGSIRRTGVRLTLEALRGEPAEPEQISLDKEFGREGGDVPAPYEVLLHAAMQGDSTRFKRQDGVEEAWRVHAAARRRAAARPPLRQGIVGPGRGRPPGRRPRPLARALDRPHERLRRHRHRQRRGRRHARPPPRPVGQARAAARARRLAAARAAELAGPRRVRRQPLRVRGHAGTTSDGKPFQPQVHYCVGGATKLYGAALYRLRAEDFGELRHHDGISPAWPIDYDEMEPYYSLAEQRYEVHGARGEDPTEPPVVRAVPVPRGQPRAAHPAALRRPGGGRAAARSTRPAASGCVEADMPHSHCVRCATCDGFPCLVHAKSDAEVLGVRPALEHANVTLMTNAEAVRLETDAAGRAVTGVVVDRAGERETFTGRPRRRVLRRREQRAAAARVGDATRIPPGSRTAPARSAATTCSTTARRCWRCRRSRTRRSSRRRSASTTSTSARPTSTSRWATSRWSGSPQRTMYRGEKPLQTRLAPAAHARRGRQARGRLLALDRGPARARRTA